MRRETASPAYTAMPGGRKVVRYERAFGEAMLILPHSLSTLSIRLIRFTVFDCNLLVYSILCGFFARFEPE
ncbi:MAG: hypothetical protein ACKOBW_14240, partial [Planctomycetota bacterium]